MCIFCEVGTEFSDIIQMNFMFHEIWLVLLLLRVFLLTISIWMVRTFLVCVLERDDDCVGKGCRFAGCPSIDPPSGTAEDPPINEIWIVCPSLYWLRGVAFQRLDILRSVCSNHVLDIDHMSGSHTQAHTAYGSPQGMNDIITLGLPIHQHSCWMWRTVIRPTSTVTSYECFACLSVKAVPLHAMIAYGGKGVEV